MTDAAQLALFCFGYGYSAACLAGTLRAEGWRIIATARTPEKAAALRAQGVEAHLWPLGGLAGILPEGAHVLISAAPDAAGDPVFNAHGAELKALAERIAWLGYLSTTAVYGDRGGDWVDEASELRPGSERGARRVAAERDWLGLAAGGVPVHVFRLAGIYGPGRGPFEKLRRGRAQRIVKPGQVFGRIHVEDIAGVLRASMARPDPGAVYNVTDDLTCPPQDVIAHAAALLGVPPPPEVAFEAAELSPMARSFYSENKRVRNDRIKRDLGVILKYPTYDQGLSSVLSHTPHIDRAP